jgi:hypothetical protein
MKLRKVLVATASVLAIAVSFGAGYVHARQPHMQAALSQLQSAREQLQMAEHNKGGHRVKAIDLINQAIQEVRNGMAYAGN